MWFFFFFRFLFSSLGRRPTGQAMHHFSHGVQWGARSTHTYVEECIWYAVAIESWVSRKTCPFVSTKGIFSITCKDTWSIQTHTHTHKVPAYAKRILSSCKLPVMMSQKDKSFFQEFAERLSIKHAWCGCSQAFAGEREESVCCRPCPCILPWFIWNCEQSPE